MLPRGPIFASIVLAAVSVFSVSSSAVAEQALAAPVDLGVLGPFYRSEQLQGQIVGQELIDIPEYLLRTDIPYRRNPSLKKEIPFVDSFSIARFLGGYTAKSLKQFKLWTPELQEESFDYVVDEPNHEIRYRPDVIERHLRPYLDAGYQLKDITLNLENVPAAIARDHGREGPYGQKEPPSDDKVWRSVIEHLASDLKTLYGETASPGFKIGNEFDTRKSFDGDADDYFHYYAEAFKVLRTDFPRAEIAPGEFTRDGTCNNAAVCVYDTADFLNRVDKAGLAPNYVPRSLNGFQNLPRSGAPAAVERARASYSRLDDARPEIHQFGLLGQPFGGFEQYGSDQGARRAAWEFQVLIGLRRWLRPERIFHWNTFNGLAGTEFELINGAGVLRLVLDRYLGSKMTLLPIDVPAGSDAVAVRFEYERRSAVVVATSTLEPTARTTTVTVELPQTTAGDKTDFRAVRYGEDDNVYLQIRRDLAADDNLISVFSECVYCTAEPMRMAKRPEPARQMLLKNRDAYEASVRSNLTFRPLQKFDGGQVEPGARRVTLRMAGNELLVIEADNASGRP